MFSVEICRKTVVKKYQNAVIDVLSRLVAKHFKVFFKTTFATPTKKPGEIPAVFSKTTSSYFVSFATVFIAYFSKLRP